MLKNELLELNEFAVLLLDIGVIPLQTIIFVAEFEKIEPKIDSTSSQGI